MRRRFAASESMLDARAARRERRLHARRWNQSARTNQRDLISAI